MSRPKLEVADIFRRHGAVWRAANKVHLSLGQRRVMTAIEACRTAALGGHVERCSDCAHTRIAYNSCRNRHCPKCQWQAAAAWLAARQAELLPVPYFHVVFTLPAAIGPIAYQNKAKLYGLLFTAASQNLQHHPHVHCIVPGGGLSPDGQRWIACKPGFFLPVRVLSRLFRRLFLQSLQVMHVTGQLQFFSDLAPLKGANEFRAYLAPLRKVEWVVYAKKPFAGSNQVLAYLARYTHRVAIANSRLLDLDKTHVRFRGKDYRQSGRHKSKVMCLDVGEFMRRFLLHVLPSGFHRIRHYGLFANGHRTDKLALCRNLLDLPSVPTDCKNDDDNSPNTPSHEPRPCPCCGGRMIIIEIWAALPPVSRPQARRLMTRNIS